MRCGTCGLVTDPTRDLCSRCFSDLRKEKIALGLSVKNPDASYEELLAKRVRIVDAKPAKKNRLKVSDSTDKKKSLFAIFRRKTKEPIVDKRQEVCEDTNNTEIAEVKAELDDSSQNPIEQSSIPAKEVQKLKLSKRQRQQMLGLLRKRKAVDEAELLEEKALKLEKVEKTDLNIQLRALEDRDLELWSRSYDELILEASNLTQSSAIQVSSLLRRDNQTALSVYFDLAYEELASPEKRREFVSNVGSRRVDSIESNELRAAVGKFQKDSAELEAIQSQPWNKPKNELEGIPAKTIQRLIAWSIDFGFAMFAAFFLSTVLYISISPLVSSLMLGSDYFFASHILSISLYGTQLFYIIFLFLFPILRSLCGFTLGEYFCKLRLLSKETHRTVALPASIGWNLLIAPSILSLGLLERRRGVDLWRERILGAKLLRS